MAVLGIRELRRYLVDKIQEVYRSQSVAINEKNIEVICRQMLRSVRVTRVGDPDFLSYQAIGQQGDRFRFMEENEKVMTRGGEPAYGTPLSPASPKPRSRRTASSPPPHSRRPHGFSPKPASPAGSTTCAASRKT